MFSLSKRGASNEYPQHMFSLSNKKNIDIFWLKKSPLSRAMVYLLLSKEDFKNFQLIRMMLKAKTDLK